MNIPKKKQIGTAGKTRWTDLLSQAVSLMIVFLMLASIALTSGRLFGKDITAKATSQAEATPTYALPTPQELSDLGCPNASLSERDSAIWDVTTSDGKAIGRLYNSARWGKNIIGFAGPTPLFILTDTNGRVLHITAQANQETEGYFGQASQLLHAWNGKTPAEALSQKVDAISGATYSSRAIIGNVQATFSALETGSSAIGKAPLLGWTKTVVVITVMLFGILAAWKFRGNKRVRISVLVLNVLVLGFWTGQFISLSLLRSWMENGVDWIGALPAVIMVAFAILLPYFGRKNFYCTWVCPYGSFQELAWMLPLPKIKVNAKVFRRMKQLRLVVLGIILLMLWMGIGAEILNYEPFTAFMFTSAPIGVVIFSAAFVVLSLFAPRLWCQALCPVGMLLNTAEDRTIPTKKVKK